MNFAEYSYLMYLCFVKCCQVCELVFIVPIRFAKPIKFTHLLIQIKIYPPSPRSLASKMVDWISGTSLVMW